MNNIEKLICSFGLFLACVSTILIIDTRLYPEILIIDKREYIVAPSTATYKEKQYANIICPEDDCSYLLNNLIGLIPLSGGKIKFLTGQVQLGGSWVIPEKTKVHIYDAYLKGTEKLSNKPMIRIK
jgi:hypothetical protein